MEGAPPTACTPDRVPGPPGDVTIVTRHARIRNDRTRQTGARSPARRWVLGDVNRDVPVTRGRASVAAVEAGHIAATFLRGLLDAGARAGVDVEAVRREICVSAEVFADPAASVSLACMTRAWVLVPAASGDPAFGLRSGAAMPIGAYGELETAVLSCRTALEALALAVRFQHVAYAMSDLSLAMEDDRVKVISRSLGVADDEDLRHYSEHGFAFVTARTRALAAGRPSPGLHGTLPRGDVTISKVARILGVSARTLQRKLNEEKVSFRGLHDRALRAEAERRILAGQSSYGEIAFALGFSQQSAFFRAFKRWTGMTPTDLRAGKRPHAPSR